MPCDFLSLPHEGIQTLAPYIPGKSIEEVARELGLEDIIKLASNENPLSCSPLVLEALAGLNRKKIASYPIPSHHPLRKKIAEKLSLETEMITLSNGSDMLFHLLLQCYALHRSARVLMPKYSFSMYEIFAKGLGIPVHHTAVLEDWSVDVDAIIADCQENTSLVFIANPNNPTGYRIPQTEILRLLEQMPAHCILVLDEAYYEFNTQKTGPESISLLSKFPNLIITRTFSKAYGLAGLRVGYAIANAQITSVLHKVLAAFTVNQAGMQAAYAALDDEQFIQDTLSNNQKGLQQLREAMDTLSCRYLPTQANFITVDCEADATAIYQHLLQFGIIVRPLHPYGLNNYLRVSVGLPEQNARFINHFKELIHDYRSKL